MKHITDLKSNKIIEFVRKKDFKFLREIGQGGTGKTVLLEDEVLNEVFVCKKYSPFYEDDKELYFNYFIDEIKILHTVYHRNIVRVFNYYLYPEQKTGFILMEYVNGQTISDYLYENPDKVEDVFLQTIDGFRYLEENNILHRDIRPENILISENGIVKIIDFGFGKNVVVDEPNKSISLNWRYSIPNEFSENIYDTKSEIYFIGKLFEEIVSNIENLSFKFSGLLAKMTLLSHRDRINSFFEVFRETIKSNINDQSFTNDQKKTYQFFANGLTYLIGKIPYGAKYNSNISDILSNLEELYKNSILEEFVQNNNKLIQIFIDGKYTYFPKKEFHISNLLAIIELFRSISEDKRKVILNNLWERFDRIEKYVEEEDDLPF